MRCETELGEQAQVDWRLFRYTLPGGGTRQIWAFVMVLSLVTGDLCRVRAAGRCGDVTAWVEGIANQRTHGTTGEIPGKELL